MRFISILLGAMVLVGVLHTRRAEACGSGGPGDGFIAAAVVVGGGYLVGTAAFGIKDLVSDDHSLGYGVGETLFNAPAAALWTVALVEESQDPYRDTGFVKTAAVFAAIHTALAAHGVYTVVKRSRKRSDKTAPPPYYGPPGAMQVGPVTAAVSPAAIRDGAGVGLSGTF